MGIKSTEKKLSKMNINQGDRKLKVAILGGGISGCACSFFLKDIFGDDVELTMLEKSDHVGGRIKTVNFNGRNYEVGAQSLHSSNFYMKLFLGLLNLEKNGVPKESEKYVAFYDSEGLIFTQEGTYCGIFEKLNMVKYFGTELVGFTSWIHTFVDNFSKFYELQTNESFTFKNVQDLLTKIDPQYYDLAKKTLRQILEEKGYNDRITNLASVTTLTNYGQSLDLDGFAGLCCLAGIGDKLWSFKNGNQLVPKRLIEKSKPKVLVKTRVKKIGKCASFPKLKNTIVFENESGTEIVDSSFDYVIVAFPIYHDMIGEDFDFDFESRKHLEKHEMKTTITYLVNGVVKLFPDLPHDRKIDLHSVDPLLTYSSIRCHLPCDYNPSKDSELFNHDGPKLYKIDANALLDAREFDKIFEHGYEIVSENRWIAAYPKFNEHASGSSLSDIVLDEKDRERVYYLNSMEWSFSGMEMSCVAAKNVAMLIAAKEKIKSKHFLTK